MERHFTATAFVIDAPENKPKRTLMLWHKRLQRWMPPGGHVDPNETPEATAKRECQEETGLDVDIIGDAQPDVFGAEPEEGHMLKKPFIMLLENIPASEQRNEPAHQHMDFVFLARPMNVNQVLTLNEHEAEDMRWFTKEDIEQLPKEHIYANVQAYAMEILEDSTYHSSPLLYASSTLTP